MGQGLGLGPGLAPGQGLAQGPGLDPRSEDYEYNNPGGMPGGLSGSMSGGGISGVSGGVSGYGGVMNRPALVARQESQRLVGQALELLRNAYHLHWGASYMRPLLSRWGLIKSTHALSNHSLDAPFITTSQYIITIPLTLQKPNPLIPS